MEQRFSISNKEKKELYHSELVRYGVTFDKAAEAAKILASGKPDELLTEKEIERVNEVCEAWLSKHKRYKNLNPLLAKHKRHSHYSHLWSQEGGISIYGSSIMLK